ncbi:hypothetical protein Agub_g10024, partial [Astrephomene gubernaculifera]
PVKSLTADLEFPTGPTARVEDRADGAGEEKERASVVTMVPTVTATAAERPPEEGLVKEDADEAFSAGGGGDSMADVGCTRVTPAGTEDLGNGEKAPIGGATTRATSPPPLPQAPCTPVSGPPPQQPQQPQHPLGILRDASWLYCEAPESPFVAAASAASGSAAAPLNVLLSPPPLGRAPSAVLRGTLVGRPVPAAAAPTAATAAAAVQKALPLATTMAAVAGAGGVTPSSVLSYKALTTTRFVSYKVHNHNGQPFATAAANVANAFNALLAAPAGSTEATASPGAAVQAPLAGGRLPEPPSAGGVSTVAVSPNGASAATGVSNGVQQQPSPAPSLPVPYITSLPYMSLARSVVVEGCVHLLSVVSSIQGCDPRVTPPSAADPFDSNRPCPRRHSPIATTAASGSREALLPLTPPPPPSPSPPPQLLFHAEVDDMDALASSLPDLIHTWTRQEREHRRHLGHQQHSRHRGQHSPRHQPDPAAVRRRSLEYGSGLSSATPPDAATTGAAAAPRSAGAAAAEGEGGAWLSPVAVSCRTPEGAGVRAGSGDGRSSKETSVEAAAAENGYVEVQVAILPELVQRQQQQLQGRPLYGTPPDPQEGAVRHDLSPAVVRIVAVGTCGGVVLDELVEVPYSSPPPFGDFGSVNADSGDCGDSGDSGDCGGIGGGSFASEGDGGDPDVPICFGCGNSSSWFIFQIRLPRPVHPGVVYLHLLPSPGADNTATAPVSAATAASSCGRDNVSHHAHSAVHRPLATLPLLVLPSTAAAEEICGLYDNMTSELQRLWLLMRTNDGGSDEDGDSALPSYGDAGTARAVAFQDHFLPFANDAAHLITSCHALVQGRSAATVTYSGSSAGGGGGGMYGNGR